MMVFKSIAYLCACKQEVIGSKYSGEYSRCSCGQCAVDQTEHYTRWVGGTLERAPNNKNNDDIKESAQRDDDNSSNSN